jgi:hypothetical protein
MSTNKYKPEQIGNLLWQIEVEILTVRAIRYMGGNL